MFLRVSPRISLHTRNSRCQLCQIGVTARGLSSSSLLILHGATLVLLSLVAENILACLTIGLNAWQPVVNGRCPQELSLILELLNFLDVPKLSSMSGIASLTEKKTNFQEDVRMSCAD